LAGPESYTRPIQNLAISRHLELQSAEMNSGKLLPRLVEGRVVEALGDSPVVLIHGPRQCGKTSLAQQVAEKKGYAYFNLDDDVARAAAQADPVGFVADLPRHAVLDEVQRVPSLFAALKLAVDRDRAPGRFLLTGSANVLLVPKLRTQQ